MESEQCIMSELQGGHYSVVNELVFPSQSMVRGNTEVNTVFCFLNT